MNIIELAEFYISIKIHNPRTAINYRQIAGQFNQFCTGSISDISFQNINLWKQSILDHASSATWNTYLRHMKALFNFAQKKTHL